MNRILQVALVAAALAVIPAIPHVAAASDGEGYLFLPIDHHDLEVKLDTDKHRLKGLDRMSFAVEGRAAYTFYLGGMFEVEKARLNGGRIKLERIEIDYPEEGDEAEGEHPENRVIYRLPLVNPGEYILEVEYGGVVYDTLKVPEGSRSGIPSETIGLIDAGGSYLGGYSTGWYPDGDDFSRFSIRVTTPPGIESVTEGKLASVVRGEKNTVTAWEVGYPTQHVTLMAADYIVREREVGGVTLMAYFFASEEELIDTYLDATEEYIELYNGLIGPYPFSKFAVVENFFPTGYGMPSYTLLGRRIVRMPFIVRTSLGHEVVHNWWGNCVYPDYDAGNWCEGLATYYADYRYESEKGDSAAVAYRRDINIDYATHVTDATDMPLVDFQSRGDDEVAGVVGYGKCLMVFHMLNNEVGDDKFYRAMRTFYRQYRFEVAVWEDIESAFEEAHGSPLDRFFRQWVYRAGAPRLSLDEVSLEEPEDDDGRYTLKVVIGTDGGFDLSHVPVEIDGPAVTRRLIVRVSGKSTAFDWQMDERPVRVAVDPDHDVFRKLSVEEIPVTISRALAEETSVVVLPSGASPEKTETYRGLADRLAGSDGTTVVADTEVTTVDLSRGGVFILGDVAENEAYKRLEPPEFVLLDSGEIDIDGDTYTEVGNAAFVAYKNPLDPGRTVCAIVGNSADAVAKAGYKVIYYGKYSYVTFLDGTKQVAGVFPVPPGPLEHRFEEPGVEALTDSE
jgi:hypothetical protein